MSRGLPRLLAASVAALALVSPGLAGPLAAQDHGNPDWHGHATAYLWFANIDGLNQIGDVSLAVGDTSKLYTSFAAEAHVGKGHFRGVATFSTTSLSNRTEVSGEGIPDGTLVDYDFSQTTAELFGWWELGAFVPSHAFQLFVGLRYTHQNQKLLDGPVPGSFGQTWIDPMAGAQYFVEMGGPFWASITGKMGGVLFGSDFAWGLGGEFGARIYGPMHLSLAYKYFDTQYINEDDGYSWDEGVTQGWFFGITFKG